MPAVALLQEGSGMRGLMVWGALASFGLMAWRKARACRDDALIHGMYGEALADAWIDVQQWARSNTAKGALFLAEPYLPGFQYLSGRPNFVDFIDIGGCYYVPSLATEIDRRLRSFGFNIRDFNRLDKTYMRRLMREATARLSAEDLEKIRREHGVEYFVFHNGARAWEEVPEHDRLYRNSHFCVIKADRSKDADSSNRGYIAVERVS
jgi:hypothetical protein